MQTVALTDVPRLSLIGSKLADSEHRIRSDLYEERTTPWSGIGAFATSVIPSGTRIFCEDPLFILPDDIDHVQLYSFVKALPAEKEAAFWALAASKPNKDVSHIENLRRYYKEGSSEDFNAFVEKYELAWSIYETNRFTVRLQNGDKRLGVFLMSARLNHSCAPNVFHRYNPLINRLTVHALRDIQPNEELLTSYIDICHTTLIRRKLLANWGFHCQCTACESADEEKDRCRRAIEDCFSKFNRLEEKRRVENDGENWTEKDYGRAVGILQRGIRFMEKEGMEESDTLGVFYTLAIKYAVKLGHLEEAGSWADKAVDIERKCLGEDSEEYQAACDLKRLVQSYFMAF
ncbi:hypothetical protein F5884DRAFT_473730 [Xylogone sp. PMI_703]|nr:hypothetical protein F5884DRAFT_473730 [Xylogone sp. PMI_703]